MQNFPPPVAAADSADRAKVLLAGISAIILTIGIAHFSYTPLLPLMHNQAGLSALAGGWLATFNYAGYMVGAIVAATLSDLGRKYHFYRLGLVVAVVSTAGMGMTDNEGLWVALRFVSGVSSAAGVLISSGLVLHWRIRQGHQPELGLHFSGLGLGIVVSGLAVAAMLGRLSWAGQWIGLGALGMGFLLAMKRHSAMDGASPAELGKRAGLLSIPDGQFIFGVATDIKRADP